MVGRSLEGRHTSRWAKVIDAGERFHAALITVPRPAELLDARVHRWAHADRVAWDEAAAPQLVGNAGLDRLLRARRPVSLPSQLIHSDLSGNVLVADGLPLPVIDFSPYWRPARYATAVILVDAVAYRAADPDLLDLLLGGEDGVQLLIRATIFRLLSDREPAAGHYDVIFSRLCRRTRA
jgi:hypothetical protein